MKKCWITGASSGIGRELALRLAARGWHVLATARREEALAEVAEEASETAGHITVRRADVTDAVQMADTLEWFSLRHGEPDMAIFNAGDYTPMPVAEFDVALCRRLMEVNYMGVVNGVSALLPRMIKRGSGELLINASVAGYRGLPFAAPYGASKAALISFAESLRCELEGSGVNIRVINPGFVKTPLTAQNPFHMPALLSTEQAAEAILAGLGKRGFEITFPARFTYFLKLLSDLPYRVYFPLIRRITGVGQ